MRIWFVLVVAIAVLAVASTDAVAQASAASIMALPSVYIDCTINQSFISTDFCGTYDCTLEKYGDTYTIRSNESSWDILVYAGGIRIVDIGRFKDANAFKPLATAVCQEDISPILENMNQSFIYKRFVLYSEELIKQSNADKGDFSQCTYNEYQMFGGWMLEIQKSKFCSGALVSLAFIIPAAVFAGIPLVLSSLVGGFWGPCGGLSLLFGLIYVYILSCLFLWLRVRKSVKKGFLRFLIGPKRIKLLVLIYIAVFLIFMFSLLALVSVIGFCVVY